MIVNKRTPEESNNLIVTAGSGFSLIVDAFVTENEEGLPEMLKQMKAMAE